MVLKTGMDVWINSSSQSEGVTRSFASSLVRVVFYVGEIISGPLEFCHGDQDHRVRQFPAIN